MHINNIKIFVWKLSGGNPDFEEIVNKMELTCP